MSCPTGQWTLCQEMMQHTCHNKSLAPETGMFSENPEIVATLGCFLHTLKSKLSLLL